MNIAHETIQFTLSHNTKSTPRIMNIKLDVTNISSFVKKFSSELEMTEETQAKPQRTHNRFLLTRTKSKIELMEG